jgi:isopenicillin N synthase-like dioxygenase
MAETKVVRLGTSLLVPSVQELAKESLTSVPERYLRPEQEPPVTVDVIDTSEIPVIDMGKLLIDDSELDRLHSACKEWGFFQLVNHGLDSTLMEKIKTEVQDFFKLPLEEKKQYWQFPGEIEGFGQSFVVSEEQKLDWGDIFFMITQPVHSRKPHLFPKLPPVFRETVDAYSIEIKKLAIALLLKMAEALTMDPKEMHEFFDDGTQSIRVNYYPPCPTPEKVIGLTPHSDSVGLTILLQANEVEGLQVRKDGKWVPVKPLPNAFVINIGDMMEIITNGEYRSIEHRATVNSAKERLSIAMFYVSDYEGEVGPAYSLIGEQTPANFKRVTVKEYTNAFFARKLNSKSYLEEMRIKQDEA